MTHSTVNHMDKSSIHSPGDPKHTPPNVSKTHSKIDDFTKINRFTTAQADVVSESSRGRLEAVSGPKDRRNAGPTRIHHFQLIFHRFDDSGRSVERWILVGGKPTLHQIVITFWSFAPTRIHRFTICCNKHWKPTGSPTHD